jgi:CRISPR type III-B/RAMP module-associated protein Cmr5
MSQQRAAAAWTATPDTVSKEYLTVVRGASATILVSGLGQALAFWMGKGTNAHTTVADALAAWLLRDQSGRNPSAKDLLDHIRSCDSAAYRRLTQEGLAYLTWLKRLAEARGGDAAGSKPA